MENITISKKLIKDLKTDGISENSENYNVQLEIQETVYLDLFLLTKVWMKTLPTNIVSHA